jgi:hypothetical protein
MADIPARAPQRGWMWQAIWDEATARWQAGTYYSSGGCANEQASPDMSIQVDELAASYGTTSAGNVNLDASHLTLKYNSNPLKWHLSLISNSFSSLPMKFNNKFIIEVSVISSLFIYINSFSSLKFFYSQ